MAKKRNIPESALFIVHVEGAYLQGKGIHFKNGADTVKLSRQQCAQIMDVYGKLGPVASGEFNTFSPQKTMLVVDAFTLDDSPEALEADKAAELADEIDAAYAAAKSEAKAESLEQAHADAIHDAKEAGRKEGLAEAKV